MSVQDEDPVVTEPPSERFENEEEAVRFHISENRIERESQGNFEEVSRRNFSVGLLKPDANIVG